MWLSGAAGIRRSRTVRQIIKLSRSLEQRSETDLLRTSRELRWQAAGGAPLEKLLPTAYALVRETARRVFGYQHYPVQILGGLALFDGGIAEMQTGEGKTLTALLPAYLHALTGKGCHIITVNDYLAARDADYARQLFEVLGLTVGCVDSATHPDKRGPAYTADITYGTAKEIGFDFLRDRLKRHGQPAGEHTSFSHWAEADNQERTVQRGLNFALVDEADSVLVDDAKTPLLIAIGEVQSTSEVAFYRWCARAVSQFKFGEDYIYDQRRRSASLSATGCHRALALAKPASLGNVDLEKLYKQTERALTAELAFRKDRDYVIVEDKISIVDESTGRILDGRKWQEGLHQAIEAKERLPITDGTRPAARITVQSFFNEYQHLAGLTGTARAAAGELRSIYRLRVATIPTHRPCLRRGQPPRVFATQAAKWQAVAGEVQQLQQHGRAVLIGTPSVESSAALSSALTAADIPHTVLNCLNHEREAEIIAQAGRAGCVTVATNMAGRGTDIKLEDAVINTGGLHVIVTEIHSSTRIDRQLVGRTARQGEPGSFQFFVSLEDEFWRSVSPKHAEKLRRRAAPDALGELSPSWIDSFHDVQGKLEKQNRKARKKLLKQEHEQQKLASQMGFDPFLENTGE